MPYLESIDRRKQLDGIVSEMIHRQVKADGDLNYILFKYCRKSVKPSYNNYKNYLAELNECACEIRRRFMAGYEDRKRIDNGDVE